MISIKLTTELYSINEQKKRWKMYVWYGGRWCFQWFFGGSLIYSMNKFIFSWLFIRSVIEQRNESKGNLKMFWRRRKTVGINEYNCTFCVAQMKTLMKTKLRDVCLAMHLYVLVGVMNQKLFIFSVANFLRGLFRPSSKGKPHKSHMAFNSRKYSKDCQTIPSEIPLVFFMNFFYVYFVYLRDYMSMTSYRHSIEEHRGVELNEKEEEIRLSI